ncbi:MAG: hypothetical protein ACJ8A6_04870, partial [Gemmatimonadales bacterium]
MTALSLSAVVHCFPLLSLFPLTAHFSPLTLLAQFPDEEAEDSASADSAAADTFNTTERYLREQAEGNAQVPVLPFLRVEGPRPALTRIVFTRDSIEWGHAATLGDLLTQVPGVYL